MAHRSPRPARSASALLALALAAHAAPARAGAPAASPPVTAALVGVGAELPAVSAPPPAAPGARLSGGVWWYPGFARDAALRAEWVSAVESERAYDYLAAAQSFEKLIAKAPQEPHTYWRVARDYAWLAELTPPAETRERARYGNLAMAWADRGLQVDPDCGECCFYKYAGMGRVALAHGILSSMSWLQQIAKTLDRCLSHPPAFVHEPWNPELGNFYYAAASFYRLLPDSSVLEFTTGIRGDPHRALDYSRRAVALVPDRVDYNVGLAASLLCVGREDERSDLVDEGRSVLERVPALPDRMPTDGLDRRAAQRLLAQPDSACGYSRDAWNDDPRPLARSSR